MEILERPRYRLIQPHYLGEQYIGEDTEIEFNGTPTEQMECLNPAAEAKMKEYLQTLEGGRTPRVEDIFYVAMKNRPREDGEVSLPKQVKEVPQMGNMVKKESDVKVLAGPPAVPRGKRMMGTVVVEETSTGDKSL